MKKIFTISLLLSLFCTKVYSLDTLRVCGGIKLSTICGVRSPFPKGVLNGVPLSSSSLGNSFPAGTEGVLDVHCDRFPPPSFDTSVYIIVYGIPKICAITSDINNHPVIYIDSSWLAGNTSIVVKRKTTTNSWQTVATISLGDSLVFTDVTANTATQSYTYVLEGACTGGNQVTTMHLQSNGSNLNWNAVGSGLRGYYIYKKDGLGNFNLLDSTAHLTYSDPNFQNGDEYYVGAFKDDGCQSTAWRSVGTPILVKSNRLAVNASGIEDIQPVVKKCYVNGNILNVELDRVSDIYISDITGRKVAHERSDKLSVQLTQGLYIMNVGAKGYKILIP
jgi:hypothetical protein